VELLAEAGSLQHTNTGPFAAANVVIFALGQRQIEQDGRVVVAAGSPERSSSLVEMLLECHGRLVMDDIACYQFDCFAWMESETAAFTRAVRLDLLDSKLLPHIMEETVSRIGR